MTGSWPAVRQSEDYTTGLLWLQWSLQTAEHCPENTQLATGFRITACMRVLILLPRSCKQILIVLLPLLKSLNQRWVVQAKPAKEQPAGTLQKQPLRAGPKGASFKALKDQL